MVAVLGGSVQRGLSLLNLSSSIFPYPHPFPSSLVESPPTLGIRLSLWVSLPTIHPKYAFGYIRLYYVTLSRYTALYIFCVCKKGWRPRCHNAILWCIFISSYVTYEENLGRLQTYVGNMCKMNGEVIALPSTIICVHSRLTYPSHHPHCLFP